MPLPKTPDDVILDPLAGKPRWTIFGFEKLSDEEREGEQRKVHQFLTQWTGQDFGLEVDAWRTWMFEHPNWCDDPENLERFERATGRNLPEEKHPI